MEVRSRDGSTSRTGYLGTVLTSALVICPLPCAALQAPVAPPWTREFTLLPCYGVFDFISLTLLLLLPTVISTSMALSWSILTITAN